MKNRSIKPCVVSVAVPLVVGSLAALISRNKMNMFDILSKPPLSPPAWLFPVVWTILYILMGIASCRIYVSHAEISKRNRALLYYTLQLGFNFFWTIFFFNLAAYTFSFVWLIAMFAMIIITTVKFYKIDKTSAYLMIPYCVWVAFAGYLNLGIAILN